MNKIQRKNHCLLPRKVYAKCLERKCHETVDSKLNDALFLQDAAPQTKSVPLSETARSVVLKKEE